MLSHHDDAWVATRLDIAKHWREHHPAEETTSGYTRLCARFGGIYEHSPWVAERVQPLAERLRDTEQLATLMADCVDNASIEEQLELIRAHPDLAGKAQVAGELTADSKEEQSRAGLDQCTAEEFERFQALNEAYKEKFGFPFIMAVRDSSVPRYSMRSRAACKMTTTSSSKRRCRKYTRLRACDLLRWRATNERQARFITGYSWNSRVSARGTYATDEFFAAKERMIDPAEPVFIDDKYDDHGKWMDGWESRRKRMRAMTIA